MEPQTVTLNTPQSQSLSLTFAQLHQSEVAVIIGAPCRSDLGRLVVKVGDNIGFLGSITWASNPKPYSFRRLLKTETVTIRGAAE
jgi:hypothetical protein